jgi:homoserine dehydrogenase
VAVSAPVLVSKPTTRSDVRVLRVGLLGLGVVGQALVALLREKEEEVARRHGVRFRVDRVLVRDPDKPRRERPETGELTASPERFLAGRHDLVVEAIGGLDPAGRLVAEALRRGLPVVSGNKTLLATRGEELHALAASAGTRLVYEASVAAGIPVLRLLSTSLQATRVHRVTAILNGTSNDVLTRIEDGLSPDEALATAQRLGFAEADPALDLEGADAAQKLCVLWRGLASGLLREKDLPVEGIRDVDGSDLRWARTLGLRLKPLAFAETGPRPAAFVAPAAVPEDHPLASLRHEQNGIRLEGDTIPDLFLSGPGAGGVPTAVAILDDLLAIARGETGGPRPEARIVGSLDGGIRPRYVRLALEDGAARVEDLLDYAARSGATFRRLTDGREDGRSVLAGVTCPLSDAAAIALRERLLATGVLAVARVYRVVETAAEAIPCPAS